MMPAKRFSMTLGLFLVVAVLSRPVPGAARGFPCMACTQDCSQGQQVYSCVDQCGSNYWPEFEKCKTYSGPAIEDYCGSSPYELTECYQI